MSATDDGPTVAPCGCRLETIGDTFVLTACPAGEACPVVQFAQAESERQGKPQSTLRLEP